MRALQCDGPECAETATVEQAEDEWIEAGPFTNIRALADEEIRHFHNATCAAGYYQAEELEEERG